VRIHVLVFFSVILSVSSVRADLGPENVLVLVNSNSATSQYVARMYRQYYPAITDIQVLQLSGLPDCSGPTSTAADEIITRDVYNTCIAEPVRQHLLGNNLIQQIMVIVTTAGMPYRIEDTVFSDVVYPAGSNYNLVVQNGAQIDAASVESELSCLWVCDYSTNSTALSNRLVNPYQGYRASSISLFERLAPDSQSYTWNFAVTSPSATPPKMEGQMPMSWPPVYGTINRNFSAGDMYLTCRLDGPKTQGKSAVFAVRQMLERSQRASDPASGVNPAQSIIVIDDCPSKTFDLNRVYNLNGSMNYYTYDPATNQPPDARTVLTMDDYTQAFDALSNGAGIDPAGLNAGLFGAAYDMGVLLDCRDAHRTSQADLGPQEKPVFFCCYGKNGDEGSASNYLTGGLNGGALFNPSNGAVFTSIESFNALTMFADLQTVPVAQGKIIDFIAIGGTCAIGHAFEPISDAAIDNVFLTYNLFSDADGDGTADLTFIEAAFTGIPFLSWAEVAIGDPLMRICYGPGEDAAWTPILGDVNQDGAVNIRDMVYLRNLNLAAGNPGLYDSIPEKRELYQDLCDLNQDGYNNIRDIVILRNLLYLY
jgi:hypothetical protein